MTVRGKRSFDRLASNDKKIQNFVTEPTVAVGSGSLTKFSICFAQTNLESMILIHNSRFEGLTQTLISFDLGFGYSFETLGGSNPIQRTTILI